MASMAKSFAPQVATEVACEALQLFGGYGWFEDHEIERIYRDSRILEIYEGTKEVQKNTIAAMILGSEAWDRCGLDAGDGSFRAIQSWPASMRSEIGVDG